MRYDPYVTFYSLQQNCLHPPIWADMHYGSPPKFGSYVSSPTHPYLEEYF